MRLSSAKSGYVSGHLFTYPDSFLEFCAQKDSNFALERLIKPNSPEFLELLMVGFVPLVVKI